MKILSPIEYKERNKSAVIDDYIEYLESATKEVEEALSNAQNLQLDSLFVAAIKKRADEIIQMSIIVEEYMGQIVLKSLDTLTLKELQSYFDFDREAKEREDKKTNLLNEKKQINSRLEVLQKQISDNLYANGRLKDFYENKDVDKFFESNKNPLAYITAILSTPTEDQLFEKAIEELEKLLSVVIVTECKIQNVVLSSNSIDEIVKKIVGLFKKCKNIANYSPESKQQLSKIILSETGIKQVLPEDFDESTPVNIINDLMNLKKLITPFYLSLPVALQERLADERLQGETYKTLHKAYLAFLKGEELPADDLNQAEKKEKAELEKKLEKINFELSLLETNKNSEEEFLSNEDKMRSVLRQIISDSIKGLPTAKDISTLIENAESKENNQRKALQDASNEYIAKKSSLDEAMKILTDPEYNYFFDSVELNNVHRLYNIFGVNVTEEVIAPFLNSEKRRLMQFEIMTDLQNSLSNLENKINSLKAKTNFITMHFSSYKESMRKLEEQYQKAVEEAYNKLKDGKLFYVNAPTISDDSTIGNVILEREKNRKTPTDFSEVSGLEQSFWNMSTGIDENTKEKFLSRNPEYTSWEEYYQNLMQQQSYLASRLFSFERTYDEHFCFSATEEDRKKLLELQKTIIEILTSIYEERKAFRQKLGDSFIILDQDKKEKLEYFLGKNSNTSRENLVNYIEQTKLRIIELEEFLANNYSQCISLGIDIPEGITEGIKTDDIEQQELEEKIKALNIDGVTNLDEAIRYRDILLGLEEYQTPPERIKQYYLEHKK